MDKEFNKFYYMGECEDRFHKLMDFSQKFLDEYSGVAKFVKIWLSIITHSNTNALYHLDNVSIQHCKSDRKRRSAELQI